MKLDEMKALCAAASEGPWTDSEAVSGAVEHRSERWKRQMNVFGTDSEGYAICPHKPDAAFIAAARTLMPKLIAVAEAANIAEQYLPDSDTMRPGQSSHVDAARDLRAALAALEAAHG